MNEIFFVYSIMNSIAKTLYGGSARQRVKTFKGGCMSIGAAVLPFGLIGLQKYFQTRKRHSTQYKKNGKWRRRRSTNIKRTRRKTTNDSI
jgi:hypothetical protein